MSSSIPCALLLQRALDAPLRKVTYKGNAPALSDLSAGLLDLVCDPVSSGSRAASTARVRAIAVTAPMRIQRMTNVPTFTEVGGFICSLRPGMDSTVREQSTHGRGLVEFAHTRGSGFGKIAATTRTHWRKACAPSGVHRHGTALASQRRSSSGRP